MGAALSSEEEIHALSLRKACEKGDHFELARLLRQTPRGPGGVVDSVDWRSGGSMRSSPAHYAARNGHDKCLELLIEHGANVGIKDFRGFSPIHEVCMGKRKSSTLQLLTKKGRCDINVKNPNDGWTSVHICAHDNAPELLEIILKNGGYVNSRTRRDYATPLHLAAARRNFKCVEILLIHGALETDLDSHQNPPHPSAELVQAIEERDRLRQNQKLPRSYLEPDLLSLEYYQCIL